MQQYVDMRFVSSYRIEKDKCNTTAGAERVESVNVGQGHDVQHSQWRHSMANT